MKTWLLGLLIASVVFVGCARGEPALPTTPTPTITALVVVVASIGPQPGLARTWQFQATATAHFSDSSARDVTREVVWTSTHESVAAIAAGGLIQARGPGWTEIRATYRGVLGRVNLGIEVGVDD